MFKPDTEGRGMREKPRVTCGGGSRALQLAVRAGRRLDYESEFYEDEDDEGPFESLLRHAPAIEAGLMPGWKLDRSQAAALLWTTPSGRQYKSTLDGSSYAPYRH